MKLQPNSNDLKAFQNAFECIPSLILLSNREAVINEASNLAHVVCNLTGHPQHGIDALKPLTPRTPAVEALIKPARAIIAVGSENRYDILMKVFFDFLNALADAQIAEPNASFNVAVVSHLWAKVCLYTGSMIDSIIRAMPSREQRAVEKEEEKAAMLLLNTIDMMVRRGDWARASTLVDTFRQCMGIVVSSETPEFASTVAALGLHHVVGAAARVQPQRLLPEPQRVVIAEALPQPRERQPEASLAQQPQQPQPSQPEPWPFDEYGRILKRRGSSGVGASVQEPMPVDDRASLGASLREPMPVEDRAGPVRPSLDVTTSHERQIERPLVTVRPSGRGGLGFMRFAQPTEEEDAVHALLGLSNAKRARTDSNAKQNHTDSQFICPSCQQRASFAGF
jgi:hypothetical protein